MRVDIKDEAEDNLRFIRGAMERAERVSALSGIGGMVMGLVALLAMAMASRFTELGDQLLIWIGSAFLAISVGALASWLKSRKNNTSLMGDASRRFLLCLLPAVLVGVVITWALWPTPQVVLVPALWMMLYGCGVLASGTYAAQPIILMGGAFIVAGLFTSALPAHWGNLLLGLAFGGLHIACGYQVYKHHGG